MPFRVFELVASLVLQLSYTFDAQARYVRSNYSCLDLLISDCDASYFQSLLFLKSKLLNS